MRQYAKKKLIFTLSPGRSGTGYLAKMLSFLPNVISLHEPEPKFSHVMRIIQSTQEAAIRFWVLQKLPYIARQREDTYIETSHLFAKGFVEPLYALGIVPDVIILSRPRREIALSLYQLNTIPGRTPDGLRFLLSPEDPGVLTLRDWRTLHDYQLCYWYCLEIERRMRYYRELFLRRGAQVVETSLTEIRKPEGIQRLIKELELHEPGPITWKNYLRTYQEKVNSKSRLKSQEKLRDLADIERLEERVLVLTQRSKKI